MDNDNEHKMAYSDVINYSIQAKNENAQFSIAIAVGIFGVLAIVVILDSYYHDIRAIAKEKNCQLGGQAHRASNYEKRYKGLHTVLVSFLVFIPITVIY
jgi:hypothetical protein